MLSSEAKAEGFVQFRGACWMLYLVTRCILKAKRSLQEQNTSTRQERWETTNCRERSCNREQDICDLTLQLQTHQRSSEFKLKLIRDDCPADITVTAAAKSNWTYRVQYSFISQWHGANFCPSLITLTHFTEVNHMEWNSKSTYQKVGMGL